MAWAGYYEFGGVEIINATRTEKYAKNAGLGWFTPVYKAADIEQIMGDQYDSPMQDDAPWTDPDVLDSYDFYGAYPLSVQGVEDSTTTGDVIESTLDGGIVGSVRRSTRTMVFQVVLVGGSECATEYGMRWLKSALSPGPCASKDAARCEGLDLCYFSCEPCIDWNNCDDPTYCRQKYQRSLLNTACLTGPTVQSKTTTSSGGEAWVVGFTIVAGNPYEYGMEQPLIAGFMNPRVDIPYVGGVVPEGAMFDEEGYDQNEVSCPAPTYQPLFDPTCGQQIILPPAAPQVPMSCFKFDASFRRRQFTIPEQNIPMWSEIVPYLEIRTTKVEARNLRIRFYADVRGDNSTQDDPCAFCGDILFSYIPPRATMVLNGPEHEVYVETVGGNKRRADALVFGSDGKPFEWPELTCGYPYIVTIDTPKNPANPGVSINMSLFPRTV